MFMMNLHFEISRVDCTLTSIFLICYLQFTTLPMSVLLHAFSTLLMGIWYSAFQMLIWYEAIFYISKVHLLSDNICCFGSYISHVFSVSGNLLLSKCASECDKLVCGSLLLSQLSTLMICIRYVQLSWCVVAIFCIPDMHLICGVAIFYIPDVYWYVAIYYFPGPSCSKHR